MEDDETHTVEGVLIHGKARVADESEEFASQVARAKIAKDYPALKALLKQVADSNYKMRSRWQVPRTIPISHSECMQHRHKAAKSVKVSFSTMSTADALLHFARQRGVVACGLNFANGETAGGGYKNGSTAQEEDLCRRIPSLYSSLLQATQDGMYPFGPPTCISQDQSEKYADVLFTSNLVIARDGEETGFRELPTKNQARVSLVSAAAPNIKFRKEISSPDLIFKTIQSIFIAPQVIDPQVNTLVLGAWGCGAFGGDPAQISELFVRALIQDNLGQLYREVHFAIPRTSPSDKNYEVFLDHFKQYNWQVDELS